MRKNKKSTTLQNKEKDKKKKNDEMGIRKKVTLKNVY